MRRLTLLLGASLTGVAAVLLAVGMMGKGADIHQGAPGSIERGKYLFETADCGGCHGGDTPNSAPAGGLGLDTPFGKFRAPNITPDKQYGIGAWSQVEFKTALRKGIGRDGEYLFPVFPYTSFTKMSDRDMEDLYAYLMSVPPVPQANKPHEVPPPFSWRWTLFFWRAMFFTEGVGTDVPTRDADWNRGNYLAHAVAHCEECHTPRNFLGALKGGMAFSGNVGGPDGQNAPNITSDVETGIGDWKVQDIERLLKTGMTPDSDQVGSGMKAVVRGTSKLTDADRLALAAYIKSLPPIHVDLPPPKPVEKKP
jgi:mono/diheme cytochrome c family protein